MHYLSETLEAESGPLIRRENYLTQPKKIGPVKKLATAEKVSPDISLYKTALRGILDKNDKFLNTLPNDRDKIDNLVNEGMSHIGDFGHYCNDHEIVKERNNWKRAERIICCGLKNKPNLDDKIIREYAVVSEFNYQQKRWGVFRVFGWYEPKIESATGKSTFHVFLIDPYHQIFPVKSGNQTFTYDYLKRLSFIKSLNDHFGDEIDDELWETSSEDFV